MGRSPPEVCTASYFGLKDVIVPLTHSGAGGAWSAGVLYT